MNRSLRQNGKRRAIKDQLVEWIRDEGLEPGDQILSQNQLAELFETTAVTVHKALTELANEGVLYREKGRGTFVGPLPYATRRGSVCFVLPGEGLDRPDRNPEYWPYVQLIFRSFMAGVSPERSFVTHTFAPGMDAKAVGKELSRHGVVFFHYSQRPLELMRYLIDERLAPVVALGQPEPGLACLTVDHAKVESVRAAVAYMISLGHRRLGFIGSRQWWGDWALEGFRQALAEAEIVADESQIIRVGETQHEGLRGAAALVRGGIRCDAVFVDSDMRALGVVEGLRQMGIRVPEDVGVMGYDGLDNATRQPPYLTTTAIPYARMVRAAIEEVERAGGSAAPHKHIEFACEIVPGRTCLARRAPELARLSSREEADNVP